jgi:hypothetical protein
VSSQTSASEEVSHHHLRPSNLAVAMTRRYAANKTWYHDSGYAVGLGRGAHFGDGEVIHESVNKVPFEDEEHQTHRWRQHEHLKRLSRQQQHIFHCKHDS